MNFYVVYERTTRILSFDDTVIFSTPSFILRPRSSVLIGGRLLVVAGDRMLLFLCLKTGTNVLAPLLRLEVLPRVLCEVRVGNILRFFPKVDPIRTCRINVFDIYLFAYSKI